MTLELHRLKESGGVENSPKHLFESFKYPKCDVILVLSVLSRSDTNEDEDLYSSKDFKCASITAFLSRSTHGLLKTNLSTPRNVMTTLNNQCMMCVCMHREVIVSASRHGGSKLPSTVAAPSGSVLSDDLNPSCNISPTLTSLFIH